MGKRTSQVSVKGKGRISRRRKAKIRPMGDAYSEAINRAIDAYNKERNQRK